eukprot:scaffold37655_cov23-Tisochrysis_lutea.AAC.1
MCLDGSQERLVLALVAYLPSCLTSQEVSILLELGVCHHPGKVHLHQSLLSEVCTVASRLSRKETPHKSVQALCVCVCVKEGVGGGLEGCLPHWCFGEYLCHNLGGLLANASTKLQECASICAPLETQSV